jgi:mono/diheme cytochrome c family protein
MERDTYLRTSPSEMWARLRAEPALSKQSDQEVWNLVAYGWAAQTTAEKQAEARELYATNCAACHGETGKGDGVMVEGLPAFDHTGGEHALSKPPDLTDPASTLGASPALLEGKLLRGGMGTGMPYWGPIFTQEQMDALVAYVYGFAMKQE